MNKFFKNFKLNIYSFISFLILLLIFSIINIIYPNLIVIIISVIFNLLILLIDLFLEPFGLLYFVSFDENGINTYFCKKLIKHIPWKEIEEINICNAYLAGKHLQVNLKTNTEILISYSKKIDEEVSKYFEIKDN